MKLKIGTVMLLICQLLSTEAQQKTNIIYILADDLGYGDLGCFGQQKILTPEIDQMAAEGMKFTQHYAGSTVCGPSRASLLTGLHSGHSPVRGNPLWTFIGNPVDMPRSQITVAKELKRAGYVTGIVGKWGMAEADLESMPLNQGFDYFYGYRKHKTAHYYYPEILWENNDPFHPEGNDEYNAKGQYSHDSFTSKAVEFVQQNADTSFFLYLAYTIPHQELTVPEDSKAPYKNLGWPKRETGRHHEPGNVTYAGMVSRMDRDIGRLLDELNDLGIAENTLVIFTSDNGPEFDNGFFDSNGPLTGKKRDLYEGGIRIPFIAYWPNHIKAGSTSEHVSAFWDFFPTACELAGVEPSTRIDGISYLPSLLGERQAEHNYLYWEINVHEGPIQAVRKDNWKAVKFYNKPIELYDLSEDVGENNNLAEAKPKKAEELMNLIGSARSYNPAFLLEPHPRILKK
ncbi:MAG: arylsulfatase [Cyclobacteriaceae bacterium]|uniref:arylsulfatase n=1 Tax=Reichenbachiella sp. TaxID=2184521 RepID=UPI003263BEE1